jgi:hypothetical protein
MFLGHYGLALASKRVAPRASLGTLVFAAQWADELWPVLLLLGVEHVKIVPGLLAASPFDFVDYPISHSLLLDIAWGVLFGGLYYAVRRDARSAIVVGLLREGVVFGGGLAVYLRSTRSRSARSCSGCSCRGRTGSIVTES